MNRREFLQQTALLAAATAAGMAPASFAAPQTRRLKKGIMYGTLGIKAPILDQFKAVKAAGLDGVEPNSHMNVDEVLRARDATGLELPSVCCSTHWNKPASHPDPDVRNAGLEGLQQALREAQRYGSHCVLFVPAVVNKEISYDQAWERSQAVVREAIPLAAELRVKIAIENVWNHFLLSPLEAARYVDQFQTPWVTWYFDAGNIVNYGWPEQWIRILGPRISQVHVKGFSRKKRDEEGLWKGFSVGLLEGDSDWPAVMKALTEINYNGWIVAEQGGIGSPEGLARLASELDTILQAAP
jgi:L-ribulose-5-phosphate 3-epimerase